MCIEEPLLQVYFGTFLRSELKFSKESVQSPLVHIKKAVSHFFE